jgi:hypothetical protein
MNTSNFNLAEDGWFNIAAPGEWPHKPTGLVQVLDDESMDQIVKAFVEFKAAPNWPGVLIDFDHQSLDADKPTVAAGWIVDLQKRDNGLWAQVRWSDLGRQSIEGGRYRFISPVWRSSDCAKLDNDRVRPLKLMNCAVTNDPNIRGLFPLSNAATAAASISAPPMEIRPTNQQGSASSPAPDAPPTPRAISIPAPFSTALVANRTAWTPAETRSRYRFALECSTDAGPSNGHASNGYPGTFGFRNRRPMTDDERRAMFARMGSGGPGDHGYGYAAPASAEPAKAPNPYAEQLPALRAQRAALEAQILPPPQRLSGFDPIDVRAAVNEAMRRPGATASDVIKARQEAEAENARRKSEWRAIEGYYKTAFKDKAAGKRALDKYVESRERQYKENLAKWERDTAKTKREIADLDVKIAATEGKAEAQDWKAEQAAKAAEDKARLQALKEQQAAIKAEHMAALAAAKAAALEAQRPLREAALEAKKPALFWKLLSQGNKASALQVYPNVNYAAAVREYNEAVKRQVGTYDKTKQREMRTEFANTPPPMGI